MKIHVTAYWDGNRSDEILKNIAINLELYGHSVTTTNPGVKHNSTVAAKKKIAEADLLLLIMPKPLAEQEAWTGTKDELEVFPDADKPKIIVKILHKREKKQDDPAVNQVPWAVEVLEVYEFAARDKHPTDVMKAVDDFKRKEDAK